MTAATSSSPICSEMRQGFVGAATTSLELSGRARMEAFCVIRRRVQLRDRLADLPSCRSDDVLRQSAERSAKVHERYRPLFVPVCGAAHAVVDHSRVFLERLRCTFCWFLRKPRSTE